MQITETHIAQKSGACGKLRQQVARDVALAADQLELLQVGGELSHRQVGQRGDRSFAEPDVQRDAVQALAGAVRTDDGLAVLRQRAVCLCLAHVLPSGLLAASRGVELLQLQTGAEAALAPTMLRIEGE